MVFYKMLSNNITVYSFSYITSATILINLVFYIFQVYSKYISMPVLMFVCIIDSMLCSDVVLIYRNPFGFFRYPSSSMRHFDCD